MTGLRTPQLARHLAVSYRQLDYLARGGAINEQADPPIPELAHKGSGGRRSWPLWTVARLEVANALFRVIREHVGIPYWAPIARRVLVSDESPPDAGWALLAADGSVRYYGSYDDLDGAVRNDRIIEGGGVLAYFELSDVAQGEVAA